MRRSKLEKSFRWAVVFCRKGRVDLAAEFFKQHEYSDGDYYAAYKIYIDCQRMLMGEDPEQIDRVLYDEKQEMLARIASRTKHPDIFLALGDICYHNSDFNDCFDAYETAAMLGNYSGFHCAAQAAESIEDDIDLVEYVTRSKDVSALYKEAAQRGHLFARGRLLHLEARSSSIGRFRYRFFRFVFRPMRALSYLILDRAHENCIPWK